MPSQQQRSPDNSGAARRGPEPLACELFQGINTAATRCGVPDQQMFWCDGWIPLEPRNLRVLPGIGPAIYTGGNVVMFDFYNIGSTPYMAVFKSDGSVIQVNTNTKATTTILPPTSIANPSITSMGMAQYGSQYLIIVSNQVNGYWVWDGSLLYGAGTLAPGVTLTNPGSGYSTAPLVNATGGSGVGATFVAQINSGGNVTNVVMTNPGSGYLVGEQPTLVFSGGNHAGSGGSLTAVLTNVPGGSGATISIHTHLTGAFYNGNPIATVDSITVTNGGSGYSKLAAVNIGGGTVLTSCVATPTIVSGVITAWAVTNGGQYTQGPTFANVTDTGYYFVSSVTINNGGTLYSPSATIAVSGGGSPQTQAVITPVVTSGVITATNITNPGVYLSNTPPTLVVNDVAVDAAAEVDLMPFGVQGTCVETFSGHVWVANGPLVQFTAPGSVSDFASSDGGGSFKSSDSFLRVGYTRLIQTNGFLFLIGDSSMNYISGVQTNTPQGGNPTTTFTNNNSDPENGTPYPASVVTIGQDIFLANQNGIFVSTGGTFEKKSEPLDGVYNTAPDTFAGMQLSAAKDLIFGKLVWMVLVPIIDPVTKLQRNKIFMFNQKYWWSSEQDVTLTFIQSQEINSVFQSYGTDGTNIYPLFQQASAAFTKRFQSRLWDTPAGYDHTKSSVNLFSIAQFLGSVSLSYNVFIDNEKGFANRAGPYVHSDVSNSDPEAFSIMPPTAIGQIGVLTGMTVETTADDLVIASIMMQPEIVQYRA